MLWSASPLIVSLHREMPTTSLRFALPQALAGPPGTVATVEPLINKSSKWVHSPQNGEPRSVATLGLLQWRVREEQPFLALLGEVDRDLRVAPLAGHRDHNAPAPALVENLLADTDGDRGPGPCLAPNELRLALLGLFPRHNDEVLGDLVEEPRRRVVVRPTPQRAAPRVRQEQALLRARDADVTQPAFLFELPRVGHRTHVREDALLHAGDEDDGELEALRDVQRHHRDGAFVVDDLVGVADERDLLEDTAGAALGIVARVGIGDPNQLLEVLDAALRLDRLLCFELGDVRG